MTTSTERNLRVIECHEPLVPVSTIAPGKILTEYQYVLGCAEQPEDDVSKELYLRIGAANRLVQAINLLRKQTGDNYRLVINTGHRTYQEQLAMFNLVLNKLKVVHPHLAETDLQQLAQRYAFVPTQDDLSSAPHLTGGAVDVSLIKGDERVPMAPKRLSIYSEISQPYYYENPEHLRTPEDLIYRDNRRLIQRAMTAAGYTVNHEERWHFDYGNLQWAESTGQPPIYGYIERNGLHP